MTFSFSDFSAALQTRAAITPEDVLAIRRAVWPDGVVDRPEAEAILAANRAAPDAPVEWGDFFIEAIVEHVVNGRAPHGYVEASDAAWLIAELDKGEAPIGPLELELVVKILETALNAPEALKQWALAEIERCVVTGEGATRRDGAVRPGIVDEAEVRLLRRIVFASGGEGALLVSRDEAEMLWRIKDSTLGADNAPSWKALFVQAVGNFLTAYSSYQPLDRSEAARLEAFVNDASSSVLGFLARMGHPDFDGAEQIFRDRHTAAAHDSAVAAAQAVTPSENAWLQAQITANGAPDPLEEALIEFLQRESGQTAG